MGIVLLILKILGITILCILGLILLLLALILFVPIRYRVQGKAESKQEWNGTVDVTWLLRIIHLRIEAQSPKSVKKKLRIFWFFGKKKDEVIFPKESPKEEAASAETAANDSGGAETTESPETSAAAVTTGDSKETAVATETSDSAEKPDSAVSSDSEGSKEETLTTPEAVRPEAACDTGESAESASETPASETVGTQTSEGAEAADTDKPSGEADAGAKDEKEEKKLTIGEKIEAKIESFRDTVSCVAELFGRRKDLLRRYFEKKSTKAAVAKLIKTAKWLLRTIAPRRGHAELVFGLKNPETTGKVYAAAATLYPWYWKHVDVYPEFSGEALRGEGKLKGRIRLFGVVIRALGLLLDKNIKKVRKEFSKVKETMMSTPDELRKIVKKEAA